MLRKKTNKNGLITLNVTWYYGDWIHIKYVLLYMTEVFWIPWQYRQCSSSAQPGHMCAYSSVLRLRATGLFFNVHEDVLLPFQEPSSLLYNPPYCIKYADKCTHMLEKLSLSKSLNALVKWDIDLNLKRRQFKLQLSSHFFFFRWVCLKHCSEALLTWLLSGKTCSYEDFKSYCEAVLSMRVDACSDKHNIQ